MIYRNAHISIGGTDLSAYAQSVEPSFNPEMQDDTAMGDTARSNAIGLDVWSFNITFLDPFASSGPDSVISANRAIGSTVAIIFRPDAGVKSGTNPEWTGTGVVGPYSPVSGSVGDQGVATVTILSSSALARATA